MHRVSLANESDSTSASVANYQHVSAGTLTTTGPISVPSVTVAGAVSAGSVTISGALSAGSASVTGAVSAGSASVTGAVSAGSATVSGAINTNTLTATGLINAQASGVLLNTGQPALNDYLVASATSEAYPVGEPTPFGGIASAEYVRIGRVVTASITYTSPGSIDVGGKFMEFRDFIPEGFRPLGNPVLPIVVFVPDAVDESQVLGANIVNNLIQVARLGFGGNPLSPFSEDGPVTIYRATLSWLTA